MVVLPGLPRFQVELLASVTVLAEEEEAVLYLRQAL
jgi:hypothetical protein